MVFRLDLASNALVTVAGTRDAQAVSLSSDGSQALISRRPGYYSIELMDLASGISRVIKHPEGGFVDQAYFSQSGKSILFLEDKTRSDDFCVVALELSTGVETCLLRHLGAL
jgi:hypothetical protein